MGGSTHTTEKALAGVQVQTSLLGQPITIGWGRARVSCNLIDYINFKAIPTTTKSGGKGGSTNTTYTYTASIIMALCEGPIVGIATVYKDSSVFVNGGSTALAQAKLSLATGAIAQAPWGYLTSLFPAHAIGYSSLAYVYAQDYPLGSGASLSNHGFEVNFSIQIAGLPDADPKDIATDFLTNASYGVTGWGAGLIGDWSDWSLYCRAANLILSPVLDAASAGSDFVKRLSAQTNSEFFWSEGVLKCKSYGDSPLTANGVTWTPNLTPVFDLTEDHFLTEVTLEIQDQSNAHNYVQVEYLDRANQYQPAIAIAQDLDNIVTYGLRKKDAAQCHDICAAPIAQQAVQNLLQMSLYVRDIYHFDLPEDFSGIEQMDYLTLTTTVDGMQLNRQLVLVSEITKNADKTLTIVADGVPGQTASAALYTSHSSGGYQPTVEVNPGNVAVPVIFNAPTSLATQTNEVWCAVSGGANWGGAYVLISTDGTSFNQVGTIRGPARYGVLTAALAANADPDTTGVLAVDLTTSLGVLGSATHSEAGAGATMSLVGNELLSYADMTLTAANKYNLSYLRRGQRGTASAAHAIGDTFVRLDNSIFKFAYDPANTGTTIYIKFQSFNIYGRGAQDTSALAVYTVGLAPATSLPLTPASIALAFGGSTWAGASLDVVCATAARATSYQFDIYKADGTTLVRSIVSATPQASYTSTMASIDGALREYKIRVKAVNAAGSSGYTSLLDVTNAAPAAVASPAAAGGAYTGVISCTASTDPDFATYVVFYAGTTGFDPTVTGAIVAYGLPSVSIYGLAAGTYYAKIAASDPWTANPALLNLSSELSFVISTGGGATPTGGGISGGGYAGGGRVTGYK